MRLPEKRKYQNKSAEVREFSFEKNYKLVYYSVFAFFLGNVICVTVGFRTIISIFEFIRLVALIVLIAWAIQYYFFRSIFYMKSMEYLMVAIFGIAPVLTALVMCLNYFVHIDENTQVYRVDKVMEDGKYQYYRVEGIPCEDYPELCIEHKEDVQLIVGKNVEITLAKGLFGFNTISEVKAISE